MESKLTPSTIKNIATSIGKGIPMKYAAMGAGIGESTLTLWLKDAKKPDADEAHLALLREVKKARTKAVKSCMALIDKASKTQWKAAMWKLSMLDPDTFGTEGRLIRELKSLIEKLVKGEA